MPVYQYACTECGEQLEVRQSFTDDALTVCPACSGRLRKVLSAVGVVFKGSGFYRTDSRTDAKAASTSGASSSNGSSSDSSSSSTPPRRRTPPARSRPRPRSKTDSKPAATSGV